MTRDALELLLAGLCVSLGLLTTVLQSRNREKGYQLNALKEECDMIEAVHGERAEALLRADWGPAGAGHGSRAPAGREAAP